MNIEAEIRVMNNKIDTLTQMVSDMKDNAQEQNAHGQEIEACLIKLEAEQNYVKERIAELNSLIFRQRAWVGGIAATVVGSVILGILKLVFKF